MKVVHVCGDSGVGKNHLISKLILISQRKVENRNDLDKAFFSKFEIEEPFMRLGPVSNGKSHYDKLDYPGLREKFKELVQENKNKVLVHQWQSESNELFSFIAELNKNEGKDIGQKIFIVWRCPWEHRRSLLEKRSNPIYVGWTEPNLRKRFIERVHRVLAQKMIADGTSEVIDLNKRDPEAVLALIKEHDIDIITHIAHLQYTSIDDHNLLLLLDGKKNQYEL